LAGGLEVEGELAHWKFSVLSCQFSVSILKVEREEARWQAVAVVVHEKKHTLQ
jgi:hypothetical protein